VGILVTDPDVGLAPARVSTRLLADVANLIDPDGANRPWTSAITLTRVLVKMQNVPSVSMRTTARLAMFCPTT
jgi:hypothetical protein